jgi:hypothetical protein
LAIPKSTYGSLISGATALSLSPADFGKLIPDKTEKWGMMIRAAKHQAE